MIAEIAVIVVLFASVASCFASVSAIANPNPSPVVTRINAATRFVVICAGIVAFPVVFGAHKVNSAVNTRIAGPRSA